MLSSHCRPNNKKFWHILFLAVFQIQYSHWLHAVIDCIEYSHTAVANITLPKAILYTAKIFAVYLSLYHCFRHEKAKIMRCLHCKFFHGKFYGFFLCNFFHYSSTMIFIKIDYKSNYSKIYMNYQWIPWNVLISSIRNIIFIW